MRTTPLRAGLGVATLVALVACAGEPPPPRRIATDRDLLDGGGDAFDAADALRGARLCAEQSHLAVSIGNGRSRTFEAEIDETASLVIGACADPAGGGLPRLRVVVRGVGNVRLERVVELGAGWRTERLALDGVPPGPVRVRLFADVPPDGRAVIRDLSIREERVLPPGPAPPGAILISLDALREDAIGALGGGAVTPALDRLVAESERFAPSWSAEISTKPSHATLLTGLPAEVHGADRATRSIAAGARTLAERLAERGVASAGFASGTAYLHPRYGFDRGFELYRLGRWSAGRELRAARDWLARSEPRPWFLFVHLYGAHSDFHRLPYEGDGATAAAIEARFGVPGYGCREGRCGSNLLLAIDAGNVAPLPNEGEIARFLYDRGVETLDRELATFFDALRAAGLWDDTLVVLTGDHGEQFGEHGAFLHHTFHEETLRVPLLVKWPHGERAGRLTERPTSSLDVTPTILARFGIAAPDLSGCDLAAAPEAGARVLVAAGAVRAGALKLLLDPGGAPAALYDLDADPGERHDLLAARGEDAARLAAARGRALATAAGLAAVGAAGDDRPFTSAELEELRSLGYL